MLGGDGIIENSAIQNQEKSLYSKAGIKKLGVIIATNYTTTKTSAGNFMENPKLEEKHCPEGDKAFPIVSDLETGGKRWRNISTFTKEQLEQLFKIVSPSEKSGSSLLTQKDIFLRPTIFQQ